MRWSGLDTTVPQADRFYPKARKNNWLCKIGYNKYEGVGITENGKKTPANTFFFICLWTKDAGLCPYKTSYNSLWDGKYYLTIEDACKACEDWVNNHKY